MYRTFYLINKRNCDMFADLHRDFCDATRTDSTEIFNMCEKIIDSDKNTDNDRALLYM